ncbi:MAG: preprotein translocase subunit YajC [Treponema sp.]|jgi:preprotein translocase subunit YajC|nr:preprotein translocase subunit YajC [Treponema sp.]
MNSIILPLLMANPQGAEGAPSNPLFSLLTFAVIIGIFYFLIIRPQNKKRKETEKMLSALKKGDKIVTIGGLYGTIQSIKETTVILKIDDNVKVEFLRSAISSVITASKEEPKEIEDNSGDTSNE